MKNNPKWQIELRKKLERDAFNEKYECLICGKKEDLHIHHLVYSEKKSEYFDPQFWRILCKSCHAKTPKDIEKKIRNIEPIENRIKRKISGGNLIIQIRKSFSNKYQIAKNCDISYQTLCNWQNGSIIPSLEKAVMVLRFLDALTQDEIRELSEKYPDMIKRED